MNSGGAIRNKRLRFVFVFQMRNLFTPKETPVIRYGSRCKVHRKLYQRSL